MRHRVIWLTGESGSGKTTIAKAFQKEYPCIILDGDDMRNSISLGAGFSREDRAAHNYRVARLAEILSHQMVVVVSVIAPMVNVRKEIDNICNPTWVYVKRTLPEREGYFYEPPENPSIILDHDELDVKQSLLLLMDQLGIKKYIYSLFIGRWQPLHDGHLTLFDSVRKEGKKILIAIRDTKVDESNPYTIHERYEMIRKKVPDAKVIVIPDIEEIVYGRNVGWGIREIRLDSEVESISATKIRTESIKKDTT